MPSRVAARTVDVRGRELDDALDELALGEVAAAHPRRLEQLVGEEVVAPAVRREPRLECSSPGRGGHWAVGLRAAALDDGAGHVAGAGAQAAGVPEPRPVGSSLSGRRES